MLNRKSHIPLYVQLADELRNQIENEIIIPGDKLPSEPELVKKYKIGRLTVREALTILENEGLIEKQRGKGSFCKRNKSIKKLKIDVMLNTGDLYFIPYYLNSICKVLETENVDIKLSNTKNDIDTICNLLEQAIFDGSDGILIQPTPLNERTPKRLKEIFLRLEETGIPYIMIDTIYEGVAPSHVMMDEFEAGRLAADYLLKNGHKHMCMICCNGYRDSDLRLAGFMSELDEEPYLINNPEDMLEAVSLMRDTNPEITGVYCYNDEYARDFYRTVQKLSLSIPHDFSVIGTDNTVIASTLSPKLTSIAHPKSDLGKASAKALLDIISNKVKWPYQHVFTPTIKERHSCKDITIDKK